MSVLRSAPPVLLAALLAAGCSKPPKIADDGSGPGGGPAKAADPWQAAVTDLKKSPDAASCRRVLNQINSDLTGGPATAPPPLPADEAQRLAAALRLGGDELKELSGSSFSGLDAVYLADALYLRDTARSLDAAGLPPDRQAALGFAWVCRQVYLRPWVLNEPSGPAVAPPLPPTAVLRRGFGSGLERGYVFLALLQQLGLDGCLVGPAGQEQAAAAVVKDGKVAKGPFWAVGARVGDDVQLFDPWRGEPVPGPGGKGVGTLGQLKKAPDQVKAWRDDKANPWDVPAKDVADAVVYVAVPMSAVTPRMKVLESNVESGLGVKLTADPKAAADRFAKGPAAVAVWAPPAGVEPFAYSRAQASFLPRAEGGLSGEHKLAQRLEQERLPRGLLAVRVPGLEKYPEAMLMLAQQTLATYHAVVLAPGYLERIQRGRFDETARGLVEAERAFAAAEKRSQEEVRPEAVREWVEKLKNEYQKFSSARLSGNVAEAQIAEQQLGEFWTRERAGALMLTDKVLSQAGRSETGFLFALCKHEQAEKRQAKLERAAAAGSAAREQAVADARDAWAAAADAWGRFLPAADKLAAAPPGRIEHARKLADRAQALAADPAVGL